jgi:copper chaperone CopZ
LAGLCCANCASKIERAVSKVDGVSSASINFMTTKMTIEGEESKFSDIVKEAERIVKRIEPDVVLKRA